MAPKISIELRLGSPSAKTLRLPIADGRLRLIRDIPLHRPVTLHAQSGHAWMLALGLDCDHYLFHKFGGYVSDCIFIVKSFAKVHEWFDRINSSAIYWIPVVSEIM